MSATDAEKIECTARAVRRGARVLARSSTAQRNDALKKMAAALRAHTAELLAANAADVTRAVADGLETSFVDRLTLDADRVEAMSAAIEEVVGLADPVGRVESMITRPNGLRVGRRRFPLATTYELSTRQSRQPQRGQAHGSRSASAVSAAIWANVFDGRLGLIDSPLPSGLMSDVDASVAVRMESATDSTAPRRHGLTLRRPSNGSGHSAAGISPSPGPITR